MCSGVTDFNIQFIFVLSYVAADLSRPVPRPAPLDLLLFEFHSLGMEAYIEENEKKLRLKQAAPTRL